jgi:hypothetical protein
VGLEPSSFQMALQLADSTLPRMPKMPWMPSTIARYCTPGPGSCASLSSADGKFIKFMRVSCRLSNFVVEPNRFEPPTFCSGGKRETRILLVFRRI